MTIILSFRAIICGYIIIPISRLRRVKFGLSGHYHKKHRTIRLQDKDLNVRIWMTSPMFFPLGYSCFRDRITLDHPDFLSLPVSFKFSTPNLPRRNPGPTQLWGVFLLSISIYFLHRISTFVYGLERRDGTDHSISQN